MSFKTNDILIHSSRSDLKKLLSSFAVISVICHRVRGMNFFHFSSISSSSPIIIRLHVFFFFQFWKVYSIHRKNFSQWRNWLHPLSPNSIRVLSFHNRWIFEMSSHTLIGSCPHDDFNRSRSRWRSVTVRTLFLCDKNPVHSRHTFSLTTILFKLLPMIHFWYDFLVFSMMIGSRNRLVSRSTLFETRFSTTSVYNDVCHVGRLSFKFISKILGAYDFYVSYKRYVIHTYHIRTYSYYS